MQKGQGVLSQRQQTLLLVCAVENQTIPEKSANIAKPCISFSHIKQSWLIEVIQRQLRGERRSMRPAYNLLKYKRKGASCTACPRPPPAG